MVCRVVGMLQGGMCSVCRVATGVRAAVFPWRVEWK